MPKIFIISTTFDNELESQEFAKNILNLGLSACSQITPIRSLYKWKSKLNDEKEFRLECKTLKSDVLVQYIKDNHSYDLPEIIIQELETTQEYYNFVRDN